MSRLLSLIAALAMTLALAACSSDDSEGTTSEGTEASSETTDDGAVEEGETDEDDAMEEDAMEDGDHADSLPVVGEVTFEGDAVEAGSQLVLTVTDLTDANPETALTSEQTFDIEDGTSPIAFEMFIPNADLDPELRYALRAQILDASGTQILTTNKANFVELGGDTADMGSLTLVSAD